MRSLSIILAATMLVLAACGGGSSTPTPTPAPAAEAASAHEVIAATLDVVMYDIYFGDVSDNISNPPVWTVKAGDAMTINLDNQGGLEHNWAIVKQGVEMPIPFMPDENEDLILWAAGVLQAGEKVSEPFPAPTEPGEYLVICTVAGHYPAMQGKLVVQ